MKTFSIARCIVLLAPLCACTHYQPAPVNLLPVPPKDSRWEQDETERVHLPLTEAGRTDLVTALKYGLNHNNADRDSAVELNAAQTYKNLLDLLSHDDTLADLSQPGFKTFFPGDRIDQVIDARDDTAPKSHPPVAFRGALTDGKYWWIFYRDANDHLSGVMVVRFQALTTLVEKKK